ncbi:Uncharacterized protein SCF082_LOCUS39543 [Durusdinium trenchii]|uniref:Uncharacterized protein n=1 Tax=Durusdinium trenchii TaxID=1381693 RepID=A0ABP0Q608_9DINO
MVSSRIMCVECAGCETEPFVEIDPWADESDVDTNQALKRAIDNVVKVNNSRTPPLPVVDIRNRWHQVTFDGCVALACTVPVFSIFAGRYIIKHYLLERWSLIFPDHHDFSRRLRTWLTSEALIWLLLVDVVLADMFSCDGISLGGTNCTADTDFLSLPVNILSNSLSLSALLLLRILEVQILDVAAHVHYHKVKARKQLEAAKADAEGRTRNTAIYFLEKLDESFPGSYHRRRPAANLFELSQNLDWNDIPSFLWRMACFSTAVLFCLLTWLQLNVAQGKPSGAGLPELRIKTSADCIALMTSLIKSYGAAVSWFHLLVNIICISQGMGENAKQLLIFSTLTSYSSIESWSQKDRESLRTILANSLSNNNRQSGAEITEHQLQHALDRILGTERLDLTNLDDVKAWLTLCFMVTGAFDWLANGDVFSPGIILVVLLVACLGVIMFTVMQDQGVRACITINSLLERDSQVLVDAAADVVSGTLQKLQAFFTALSDELSWIPMFHIVSLLGVKMDLFGSLEAGCFRGSVMCASFAAKVAMLDDKQQILGITITETSRNAWVVSLLFAFLGSLLKVLQDMRRGGRGDPNDGCVHVELQPELGALLRGARPGEGPGQ